ncbi:MAG: DUF4405 domain-containing protein [Bacillota bacterium]
MLKTRLNYWLGWLLFLTGLGLVISGFVRWFVLQGRGWGAARCGTASFIVTYRTWTEIHQWFAVAFTVLVLLHICLHWNWLVAMTRRIFNR